MHFADQVSIRIRSGNGGDGCVSFRREKYVPHGGPDGGDGGNGGGFFFVGANDCNSLADYHHQRSYCAENAKAGKKRLMHGADGNALVLRVPLGCLVRDANQGDILLEILEADKPQLLLAGGHGGRGNAHFKSSTQRAPRFAEEGKDGVGRDIVLELKLIADIGLVGFPNAGKSTLISCISNSRPKIANYPFTTLTPNLGVVESTWHERVVVADIPGLIDGAHCGKGLGRKFLQHIERTTLLLMVFDAFLSEEELLYQYEVLLREMALFSADLLKKPRAVVLNKQDLLAHDPSTLDRKRNLLMQGRIPSFVTNQSQQSFSQADFTAPLWCQAISAVTHTGIPHLINTLVQSVHSP